MDFSSIIGQDEIVADLKNISISGRVGHAYLFSGSKGIGKRTVARVFAKLLLCQGDKEGSICNDCIACQLFDNGSHPDLNILEPGNSSIGVEEIRKIQSDIIVRPMYSGRKVYLIPDADKMTIQAQNCLLKTLEEPPAYAVIILTASNPDSLMETVRSRVLKYAFRKNSPGEIKKALQARCGENTSDIDFIIAYSDGIIGTALELADSPDFTAIRGKTIEILLKIAHSKLVDIFDIYDFFEKNKDYIDAILDVMILFYRDLIIGKKTLKENVLINSDKKDIIFNNKLGLSTGQLMRNIEIIENTRKNIKQNANYQLSIEVMLMNLQEDFC